MDMSEFKIEKEPKKEKRQELIQTVIGETDHFFIIQVYDKNNNPIYRTSQRKPPNKAKNQALINYYRSEMDERQQATEEEKNETNSTTKFRLKDSIIKDIKIDLIKNKISIQEAALKYGISDASANSILKGRTYKNISCE